MRHTVLFEYFLYLSVLAVFAMKSVEYDVHTWQHARRSRGESALVPHAAAIYINVSHGVFIARKIREHGMP